MAAIALIVANTASTAATKTKAALEAEGHTVTFVVEGNIGTTDFSGFDCAAAVACTANSTVANALRSLVDDDALPMFVGSVSAGLGAAYIPQLMNLCGSMTANYVYGTGPYAINITNATHDITAPFGTGALDTMTGTSYWASVASGQSIIGVQLALGTGTLAGLVDTFAIPRGTMDLAGTPVATGARMVVSGALYGGTHPVLNYTADGRAFLDAVVEWLIEADPEPTQPTIDAVVELPAALALTTSAFEAAVGFPADEHDLTTVEVADPADTTFAAPLFTFTFEFPASLTSLLLDGLDSLTEYIFRVKYTGLLAVDSPWSATGTATTLDAVVRPVAPTVAVTDHGHDFVEAVTSTFSDSEPLAYLQSVQWQIRITATAVVVYDSGFIAAATDPPTIDYHGLTAATGYQIRARHFDGYLGAASLWGAWAAFTTDAAPADAPLAPDVTVTVCDGTGDVSVTGTAFAHSDPPATHAATQWRAAMGGGVIYSTATAAAQLTAFTWLGLPPGAWTFSARYQDSAGRWGDYGGTDTCTVVSPPAQPALNHSGSTRVCANITISWDAPADQAAPVGGWRYRGQLSSDDGATWVNLFTTRTATYHLFKIAAYPDAVYLFRVRAEFPAVTVPGDWSYLVLRVDRSCAETTVYDFSTLTALDADWEVFWDNDAANVWWRPVDQWGREQSWWTPLSGGAYGIMASGLKIGHQTRSALAFKELGQPTLYEAETEFVIWGSECYWPGWRWAHTVLMRGGLAYAINGHDDDPTPNTRGGVCQTASSGNNIFGGPYFGGTCCWHCDNLCLNGCVAANGCQCVQAIEGWWQVKRVYPDRLIEYGTPSGSGFIQHWGFRPGNFVQSSYENATIPHAGIKQRGLSVTRNACGSYYPTPDACTPYHTKYVFRQKVERTVTGGIRMRAMVVGPGVDPAAGWTIDKTLSYAEAQAMGCGWVGLAFDELHSYIPDTGIIFRSFSITPVEYDDCLAPEILPEPDPVTMLGRPCSVILFVYEDDRETVAWQVGDYRDHSNPFLCVLENYGEQELDVVNGAATIGQVEVIVIDPSQVAGDQNTGWMTERLGIDGIGVIHGRRCRVLRYISEALGWVVIADGPASSPRMDDSYAAFRWVVRDTRETERKAKVFVEANTSWLLPMGVEGGWGAYVDEGGADQWLVPPAEPLVGPYTRVGEDRGVVTFFDYWHGAPPSGFYPGAWIDEEAVVLPAVRDALYADAESLGDPLPMLWTWPDLEILWRIAASGDEWTVVQPSDVLTEGAPPYTTYWWRHLVRVLTTELDDGTPVLGAAAMVLRGLFAVGTFPESGDTIEVAIRRKGIPTDFAPLHIEGLTTGQLLKKLYDGEYSRPDPFTGGVVPTGNRNDEADLLEMRDRVLLRLTAPVDDVRAWSEKMIYAPTGWCAALDNDGKISPKSQVPPDSFDGELLIDNAHTEPAPDWGAGERIVNVVRFTYPRYYRVDPADSSSVDLLEIRDVEHEYRNEASIDLHTEKVAEFDGAAFAAIGDPYGQPIMGLAEERGFRHARNRHLYVLHRYQDGAPIIEVAVMRVYCSQIRAGDWVRVSLSWFPEYDTGERGMLCGAQVLAVYDVDCAWRILLIERVAPLEGS